MGARPGFARFGLEPGLHPAGSGLNPDWTDAPCSQREVQLIYYSIG